MVVYAFVILALVGVNLLIRGLFVFNLYIDVVDMLLIVLVSWFIAHVGFGVHNAISLIIGAIAAQIVYVVFRTRIGFWVITVFFSALWAYATTSIVMGIFNIEGDDIWFWTLSVFGFVYNCFLHHMSRQRAIERKTPFSTSIESP